MSQVSFKTNLSERRRSSSDEEIALHLHNLSLDDNPTPPDLDDFLYPPRKRRSTHIFHSDIQGSFARKSSAARGRLTVLEDGRTFSASTEDTSVVLPPIPSKFEKKQARSFKLLYPLAYPKARQPKCEMCSQPATRCCRKCGVTYYCGADHFDFDNNHPSVCDLIKFVRTPRKMLLLKSDRDRMESLIRLKKQALVDKIIWIGIRSMLQESYEQASLAFYQAIHYSKDVYQDRPMDMARVYMYRTECVIKLGDLKKANFNLSLAEYCMQESKDVQVDTDFLVNFHRIQGLLHMAQKEWDDALYSMAESIYFQSEIDGPNSRATARSYFHMGEIFENIGQEITAIEYYTLALQNYTDWLISVYCENYVDTKDKTGAIVDANPSIKEVHLPMLMEGDAIILLKRLEVMFSNPKGIKYGQTIACLGFLTFFKGSYDTCKIMLKSAWEYLCSIPDARHELPVMGYIKEILRMIDDHQTKKHLFHTLCV